MTVGRQGCDAYLSWCQIKSTANDDAATTAVAIHARIAESLRGSLGNVHGITNAKAAVLGNYGPQAYTLSKRVNLGDAALQLSGYTGPQDTPDHSEELTFDVLGIDTNYEPPLHEWIPLAVIRPRQGVVEPGVRASGPAGQAL